MKKIDKLVLQAFLGPFFITFSVVLFILLTQHMVGYLNDLMSKGLDILTLGELMFYFGLSLTPLALPLAILIASLITFGNLGEHNELTAIKSGGISLIRVLIPISFIILGLTALSYWFNNQVIPFANLQAYSLLYDIKQKKPSLELKEGTFYDGIPGYSVKIKQKYPDGKTLKDVMIYDHTRGLGNTDVILADSGQMSTILDDRYMVLELFNGKSYQDNFTTEQGGNSSEQFIQNDFVRNKLIFSLESFQMKETDKSLFSSNKLMRNTEQLEHDIDSLTNYNKNLIKESMNNVLPYYKYHLHSVLLKDTTMIRSIEKLLVSWKDNVLTDKISKDNSKTTQIANLDLALISARNIKSILQNRTMIIGNLRKDLNSYTIEWYRKYRDAIACLTMFLIGAPLGAIIKKGGLGIPILISIIFFIIFYILTLTGEKWVKESFVEAVYGMWAPNFIMFVIGLFFLRQARNDSRILEADAYWVLFNKIKNRFQKKTKVLA